MLDVTKATLLFARGVVLVEGISEALLLPALARRLGVKVAEAGVSIIPLAGVDFATIAKLFGQDKLTMPLAIVTDADPAVELNAENEESPKPGTAGFDICPRVKGLQQTFSGNSQVSVFHSKVTLEYDLAEAGSSNPDVVFEAWASCYERAPRSLAKATIDAASTHQEKALLIWRVLCRGQPAHGKAELAQALAGLLEERQGETFSVPTFAVPDYLEAALRHANRSLHDLSGTASVP